MVGKSIFQKAGLMVMSVLLSFLLLEAVLRVFFPAQLHYFVWQPGLRHRFYPDTAILNGLQPATCFTINRYGLRTDSNDLLMGPDLFNNRTAAEEHEGVKYYLSIGASTTECLYLDDGKTWPAQFASAAMKANDPSFRFIGNLAKSGCTMRESYIQLKYCAEQYKKVNVVLVMSGLNDMLKRLSQDTFYKPDFRFTQEVEDSFVNTIFLKQGRGQGKTWFRRSALFYLFQNAYHRSNPNSIEWMLQDNTGKIYNAWRENRQHAKMFIDTLPEMRAALDEYGRLINLMIDEAQRQKLKIIFINESAIWKDSMPVAETRKLWQGGIGKFQMEGGHVYYSPKALRQGLDLYNMKLAEVCKLRAVQVIDIDTKLPHDLSVFYDDCHFTNEGAQQVGQLVYKAVAAH